MAETFPEVSLATDRLMLRSFDEEDLPTLAEMMADDNVAAAATLPALAAPLELDRARAWALRDARAERLAGRAVRFAVAEFLTDRLVGVVEASGVDWHRRSAEIEFVTAPWARGEGYAPEFVLALVRWLFDDQKFARVQLRTGAENAAAQQVAQKIGCISEGVLRAAGIVGDESGAAGARTDLILWGLLPEDLDGVGAAGAEDDLLATDDLGWV